MKRLISAALALSLLGASAASAQPYRHGGHHRSHNGGNSGAAILGIGLGLFALSAIAASSQRDRYEGRYYDRYDYGPPPPPPPRYRYDRHYRY